MKAVTRGFSIIEFLDGSGASHKAKVQVKQVVSIFLKISRITFAAFGKNVKHGYFANILFHSIIDSIDKRGRPIKKSSKEDLEKFYDIDEERDDQPTLETGMDVTVIVIFLQIIIWNFCRHCFTDYSSFSKMKALSLR